MFLCLALGRRGDCSEAAAGQSEERGPGISTVSWKGLGAGEYDHTLFLPWNSTLVRSRVAELRSGVATSYKLNCVPKFLS